MKSLSLAIALAGLAIPLSAQVRGSINQGAPTVSSSIEFSGGGKVEVSYIAANFGRGDFLGQLENSARAREGLNKRAAQRPLGSLEVTKAMTIGGQKVAAGEYDLYFTIDDDVKWHLILSSGGDDAKKVDIKLDLKDTEKGSARLKIVVTAGDGNDECDLAVAFGSQAGTIAGKVGRAEAPTSRRGN